MKGFTKLVVFFCGMNRFFREVNENKLDEMKELLWRVIQEIPRDKENESKNTITRLKYGFKDVEVVWSKGSYR